MAAVMAVSFFVVQFGMVSGKMKEIIADEGEDLQTSEGAVKEPEPETPA
jgi:hypothetical protein